MNIIPLQWGLCEAKIQELVPEAHCSQGYVRIGMVVLKNFPGDCGSLLITGANNATKSVLKDLYKIASHCGFNKVFATVVGNGEYPYIKEAVQAFKANRAKLVHKGYSNRTTFKEDYVFVKIIYKPKWVGYSGKG